MLDAQVRECKKAVSIFLCIPHLATTRSRHLRAGVFTSTLNLARLDDGSDDDSTSLATATATRRDGLRATAPAAPRRAPDDYARKGRKSRLRRSGAETARGQARGAGRQGDPGREGAGRQGGRARGARAGRRCGTGMGSNNISAEITTYLCGDSISLRRLHICAEITAGRGCGAGRGPEGGIGGPGPRPRARARWLAARSRARRTVTQAVSR